MSQKHLNIAIAIFLIVIGVTLRVMPHPANFAPVAALAIFGGAILPRKSAIWVPLGAMMMSDAIIGFHSLIAVTWGCYALFALASSKWLKKPSIAKGATITIAASMFFFIVTNFAVWATSGMYAHTWNGIVQCYTMALPFFRNTMLSDMIYTAAFFGTYALAISVSKNLVRSSVKQSSLFASVEKLDRSL